MNSAPQEQNAEGVGARLNWLRAAVLGADDGIVSVAALLVGVAGATDSASFLLTSGVAGLVAGALSMAVGEYVSVSTQRDTERALIAKEKKELIADPAAELKELGGLYEKKGLTRATAEAVARELTAHDVLAAHAEIELHINPKNLTNPWAAALASAVSFTLGGILPLTSIMLASSTSRIPLTFIAVIAALGITGSLSAKLGGANVARATARVVLGGALAMAITYGIGAFFGVSGI